MPGLFFCLNVFSCFPKVFLLLAVLTKATLNGGGEHTFNEIY